jgi:hypothetical protein
MRKIMKYPVIEIPADVCDTIEQLGTKEKFWFYHNEDDNRKLFKIGRFGTGENWSEKATSELAKLLGLSCAEYEFAIWKEKEGVISTLFVPQNGRLVHGNELLGKVIENYPKNKFYKVREYNIFTTLAIIKKVPELPIGYEKNKIIKNPLCLFVGYLMFDCWISNPDRHHENWGCVLDSINKRIHLAPTYDHASGLGCRVSDKERRERRITKDKRYSVENFVGKTKSAFYDKGLKQLKTIEVFLIAAKQNRKAAEFWLNKLESISYAEIENIFTKIPDKLISGPAIDFALAILEANKKRLL